MPNASVDHTKIASPHTEKAPVRKYNAAPRAEARLAFLQMRKAGHSIAECGRRIGVSNGTAMRWENLAKGGKLLAEDALRLRLSRDEAVAILARDARESDAGADRRASIELLAKLGEIGGLAPTRQRVDQRGLHADLGEWVEAEARALKAPSDKALPEAPPERPIRSIMSTPQDAEAQALAGDAEMCAVEATVETPPAAPPASVNESDQHPAKNFPKISAQTESAPK